MAATRSQEQATATEELQDSPSESHHEQSKRKAEPLSPPRSSSAVKKQKLTNEDLENKPRTIVAALLVSPPKKPQNDTQGARVNSGSFSTELPATTFAEQSNTEELPSTGPIETTMRRTPDDTRKLAFVASPIGSERKKLRSDSLKKTAPSIKPRSNPGSELPGDMKQTTHRRFGSEEQHSAALPSADVSDQLRPDPKITQPVSEDEDDAAPEVVTQAAGFDSARSEAAVSARIAKAQKDVERQKRRERDVLFKQQAKITKQKTKFDTPGNHFEPLGTRRERFSRDFDTKSHQGSTESKSTGKSALPAFLPDDILAAEPSERPPTPPLELERQQPMVNKKQIFLERASKPPKDIRKGGLRIRVLENTQMTLPPKALKSSKAIRESWLAGRPGIKGKMSIERRKVGGGFVRA
ncbi:MAG: hypothetical protein Q9190_005371 [Brigantiaea leucoxantha]